MPRLPRQLEGLARMIGYLLGRRPDEFGLILAPDGSVPIKHFLQVLSREPGWGFVRRHHLDQLLALMQPPTFVLEGDTIRSLEPPPDLRRPEAQLPPLLYTAITPKAHARVWEEGLAAPPDKELVLAVDRDMALRIGRRRSPDPVLVIIQAQAARQKGSKFVGYGEGLFLTDLLPRDVLQLPTPPPASEKPRTERPQPVQPTPGSFFPDFAPRPKEERRRGKKAEPDWKSGARAWRKERQKGEKGKGPKG